MRVESIIHSICADLSHRKNFSSSAITSYINMPCAHQSKSPACVRVKTSYMRVKDLTAIRNRVSEYKFVIFSANSAE